MSLKHNVYCLMEIKAYMYPVVLLMFQIEENKPCYFFIPDLDPYFKLSMDVIKENEDCY